MCSNTSSNGLNARDCCIASRVAINKQQKMNILVQIFLCFEATFNEKLAY